MMASTSAWILKTEKMLYAQPMHARPLILPLMTFQRTVKSMQPRMMRKPPIIESMAESSADGDSPLASATSGVTGPIALKHSSATRRSRAGEWAAPSVLCANAAHPAARVQRSRQPRRKIHGLGNKQAVLGGWGAHPGRRSAQRRRQSARPRPGRKSLRAASWVCVLEVV